jgi:hypothetical protein
MMITIPTAKQPELEMKSNGSSSKASNKCIQARKHRCDSGSRKEKSLSLRQARHMLDKVASKRTTLSKENEIARKNLAAMQRTLKCMPTAVQEERARLMAKNRNSSPDLQKVNEGIRQSLNALNFTTIQSMPIIVAASTSTTAISQETVCNRLLTTVQQSACGELLPEEQSSLSSEEHSSYPPYDICSASSAAAEAASSCMPYL